MMLRKIFIGMFCLCSIFSAFSQSKGRAENYSLNLDPVDKKSVLKSDEYYTWGASPIKGEDGLYHLYYSRWKKEYGFLAWVTHSEVAHAVSEKKEGPYRFSDLALPARGAKYWDGLNTHNPTIHRFGDKYYLYYTGNTGDGRNMKSSLNPTHRNNQRIGVAVSESPYGPWKRFDIPLIDVSADSTAWDAKMIANPSITQTPDGKYLMVYKAVAKKKGGLWGGPVVHLCATSDSPTGPFKKYPQPIFTASGSDFPAEDPYIWCQDGLLYAIVKDMHGSFTNRGRSLALFYSKDGFDWKPVKSPLVSVPEIRWKDGTLTKLVHLERPQLLIEDGKPTMLFLAADAMEDYAKEGVSFNVHVPISNPRRPVFKNYQPLVNQAGYNLNEAKRFVCFGAPDNTPFKIINIRTGQTEYEGRMLYGQGWFTDFNPRTTDEFIVEVKDRGTSVPFWIADHLMEKVSGKLAYDFFIDVRGSEDPVHSNEANVYGGGPSRDQGAFGLEALYELLYYSSNPALFDNWTTELGDKQTADLIDLMLWHGEFAYHHVDFNGPIKNRHGTLGYEGEERMIYDYWNTLDHLAPLCAAYHSFLKPYLSKEKYENYRKVCLEKWEAYDRHKVVRYWTYSTKWVDYGFQEFNEMGNVFGQSVFSNLFMYLCELNEPDGNPDKFLKYAQESAQDIIDNWDFNNPRHMWWIRNGEHITPQALAFFLMVAPDKAPEGTLQKLRAWANHIRQRTNNCWQYRTHSETEFAHPQTKELGGAPALGGSLFAASYLLNDDALRRLGWAQVDFVFGANPVGTHIGHKSAERVAKNGFWEGVEYGWPDAHPNGYGMLGSCRGTLEGTPLDGQFPRSGSYQRQAEKDLDNIGNFAYATEGWAISNRGWMATLTFATLGSHSIGVSDSNGNEISSAKVGDTVVVELKAALNIHWDKKDKGWVEVKVGDELPQKISVEETDVNSGIFRGNYVLPKEAKKKSVVFSYGYMGFEKTCALEVK